MRFTQSLLAVGVLVVSTTLPNGSWAKSAIDARVARLENIVENELNINFINQLDQLQNEVRDLRGRIEEQEHFVKKLQVARTTPIGESVSQVAASQVPVVEEQPIVQSITVAENTAVAIQEEELADTAPKTEKSLYDLAYRHMSSKNYVAAITEFKDLLWQHPEGTYAPNAYYWLGEIYLLQWQQQRDNNTLLTQAKESFNTVLENFPEHHKAIDALLKLGFIELDQENWLQAKELLSKVIAENPGTSRARLAEARLQKIQQEGR